MCGIGGWYSWSDRRPTVDMVRGLLLANQTRGRSAAGIAFHDADGQVMVRKGAGPAEDLVKTIDADARWDAITRSPRGLIHARATTKGSESNNLNNHPVAYEHWLAVHNGHVSNDDDLFHYYEARRNGEVDTEAIPMVMNRGTDLEDSIRNLTILGGNATLAAWPVHAHPDHMILARLGHNDLYMFLIDEELLLWSSAACFWQDLPSRGIGKLRFIPVSRLQDNKAVLLTPSRESVETYDLVRRPFIARRGPRSGSESNGNQPRQSSEAPVASSRRGTTSGSNDESDSTVGEGLRFRWERPEGEPFTSKPAPDYTAMTPVLYESYDFVNVMRKFDGMAAAVSAYELPTLYGRYIVDREGHKCFKPRKGVKNFWRKQIGFEWWNFTTENPKYQALSRTAVLEPVIVVTKLSSGEMHAGGYACPWCGIIHTYTYWKSRFGVCDYCQIPSWLVVPKDGLIDIEKALKQASGALVLTPAVDRSP